MMMTFSLEFEFPSLLFYYDNISFGRILVQTKKKKGLQILGDNQMKLHDKNSESV